MLACPPTSASPRRTPWTPSAAAHRPALCSTAPPRRPAGGNSPRRRARAGGHDRPPTDRLLTRPPTDLDTLYRIPRSLITHMIDIYLCSVVSREVARWSPSGPCVHPARPLPLALPGRSIPPYPGGSWTSRAWSIPPYPNGAHPWHTYPPLNWNPAAILTRRKLDTDDAKRLFACSFR